MNRADAIRKISRFLRCMAAQVSGDKRPAPPLFLPSPPTSEERVRRGGAGGALARVYCRGSEAVAAASSTAIAETVAEEVFQFGNGVDLANGRLDVVLDAAIADGGPVEQNVAGAPVAVARLTHRADVAERLALVEVVDVLEFLGTAELIEVLGDLLGEDAGDVRVALEAVALDQGEDALHLALVVNVLGKDVLVKGVAGRAVDEQHAVLTVV